MVSSTLINGVVIAVLAILLIAAAVDDLREFRIPNHLVIGIAALYPAHVMTAAQPIAWMYALGFAAVVFVIGFVFFAMKAMGGGDVKLMAAVSLWAAPHHLITLFVITLAGSLVIALVFAVRTAAAEARAAQTNSLGTMVANLRHVPIFKMQIPYGVGISAGGLYIASQYLIGQG